MAEDWKAPGIERADPDRIAVEQTAFEQWLYFHRTTLLSKCADPTAEQLKRHAAPPSALSLLRLMRPFTEVEPAWFRMRAAGEKLDFPYGPDQVGADFDDISEAGLRAYVQEIEAAEASVASKDLAELVASYGGSPARTGDIRWICLHDRGLREAQRARRPVA